MSPLWQTESIHMTVLKLVDMVHLILIMLQTKYQINPTYKRLEFGENFTARELNQCLNNQEVDIRTNMIYMCQAS